MVSRKGERRVWVAVFGALVLWACASGPEGEPGEGGAGGRTGGAAGAAGAGMNAPAGGNGTGGTGGSAGAQTGGRAGVGGTAGVAAGGMAGTSSGGTSGAAGSAGTGGRGGMAPGGMAGVVAGMGGTAGAPVAGSGGQPATGEPAALAGITEAHNVERRMLGLGELTWDPALARIAQAWAEKCVDMDNVAGLVDHNPNRAMGYNGSVGENIYGHSAQATASAAVAYWIAEKSAYNYAANTCSAVCGHYTQVVWRGTTKVGCGLFKCPGLKYGSTIVCDYSPAGNVNGQRPY